MSINGLWKHLYGKYLIIIGTSSYNSISDDRVFNATIIARKGTLYTPSLALSLMPKRPFDLWIKHESGNNILATRMPIQ
jgi:hypothetical protein